MLVLHTKEVELISMFKQSFKGYESALELRKVSDFYTLGHYVKGGWVPLKK